jgi:DNA-binding NtrC family response regulator
MAKILVADDNQVFLKVISSILIKQGYTVVPAASGQEALDLLKNESFDLLISDILMEPVSGIDLLKQIHQTHKELCVIMLTSCEKVDVAIHTMKLGAFDYLTKPIQMNELIQAAQRALEYSHSSNSRLAKVKLEYNEKQEKLDGMVAQSNRMLRVCDIIEKIAPTHANVLICGEPGSGTELAARNLHRCSPRGDMPFVKIDCEAISPDLLATKLFGKDDSSTESLFEDAMGGTLFIHKIEKLPVHVQDQLVQTLEKRARLRLETDTAPDVRVISNSSEDIKKLIKTGSFREDLYHRLRTFFIDIPPLRDRQEDIIPLIARIVFQHTDPSSEMPMLNRDAEELLKHYRWPGNVDELITTVQYALTHLENNTITKSSLPSDFVEEALLTCEVLNGLKPTESLKGRSLKAFLHNEMNGPVKKAMDQQKAVAASPDSDTPKTQNNKNHSAARDDSSSFEWI